MWKAGAFFKGARWGGWDKRGRGSWRGMDIMVSNMAFFFFFACGYGLSEFPRAMIATDFSCPAYGKGDR